MNLETWWPLLRQESRDWIMANNGDALITSVLDEIISVGGPLPSGAWWVGEHVANGLYLSDAGVDWVEEVANGEVPEASSER